MTRMFPAGDLENAYTWLGAATCAIEAAQTKLHAAPAAAFDDARAAAAGGAKPPWAARAASVWPGAEVAAAPGRSAPSLRL